MAIAGGGFAYMDSNTVAASNAGEGAGIVSGYSVYNLEYSGVSTVGNPGWQTGTMEYNPGVEQPIPVTGSSATLTGQDTVAYVSFQLSPDNAHWAAVQAYGKSGNVISGGGASNCQEYASPSVDPAFSQTGGPRQGEGSFSAGVGIWSCRLGSPLPAVNFAYVDVEAAQ